MKKVLAIALAAAMVLGSMAGCGAKGGEGKIKGAKIEFATRQTGDTLERLRTVVANFEKESGVKVELTEYANDDYESALKTRMASGELPDVWETHGWSRLRYGEYLAPVNDEAWYANENDLAKGILTGDGDTAYALMLTTSVLGICVNVTAAEECGVDVYAIETYDDLTAACQKIVDAGKVPFVTNRSGGDFTHVGGQFTTYDDALVNDAKAQLDGTYDFESFRAEIKWFAELMDMGAFWPDVTTASDQDNTERFAKGESVFYFANGADFCRNAAEINSDNTYAVIAFPAIKEGAKKYMAGGEGYAVGAWKDGKNLAAAKALLAYLAEHGGEFVEGLSAISTVKSVDTPATRLSEEAMQKYADAVYVNMWDREYMPSGMWGVFGDAVNQFYADWSDENIESILAFLKTNYDEKYAAMHSAE